jgi:hypothetical protein
MSITSLRCLILSCACVLSLACTSPREEARPATESPVEEAKPTEFRSGRSAFQTLYVAARNWSIDAQPIHIESRPRKEDQTDGKAAVWAGMFASPSKQATRSFLWSGSAEKEAPERGVTPGSIGTFSAGNISTQPFQTAYLKIDSDRALQIANKKGGTALLKKDPEQPIKYELNWEPQKQRLVWRVVYGTSDRDKKLAVVVNASSGEFVKTEK